MIPVTAELFYAGAWHAVPAYTRTAMSVSIGRMGEGAETPPSAASFVIDNRTGLYNPLNPVSPLYGQAGRNTPVRITIGSTVYELEVSKWTPGRSVEPVTPTTGDAWMTATLGGRRRRMGAASIPLKSAHYRHLKAVAAAHWPLDEGNGATVFTDTIAGRLLKPAPYSKGAIMPGQATLEPWHDKGVHLDEGVTVQCLGLNIAPSAGQLAFTWTIRRAGDQNNWSIFFTNTLGDALGMSYFHASSALEINVPTIVASTRADLNVNGPIGYHLLVGNSGADMTWALYRLGNPVAIATGTKVGYNTTAITGVLIDGAVDINHVAIMQGWPAIANDYQGNPAETSDARFNRLCTEESLTHTVATLPAGATGQAMGPQYPGTMLDQLRDLETTDGGIITDSQTGRGLTFYPAASRYNRSVALTIDYGQFQLAPVTEPVLDDLGVRNDLTVKRRDGASARAVQLTGPNNVQDPTADPQGIGPVIGQDNVNAATDELLAAIATWRLQVATVHEMRWPTVNVDMVATPGLAIANVGDRIQLVNLPPEIGAASADLLVIGRVDTAAGGGATRIIRYVTVPYSPWNVGVYGAAATVSRYDTAGAQLAATYNAGTDPTMSVATTLGPLWTDNPAAWPFLLKTAGVVVQVDAVGDTISPNPSFETDVSGWAGSPGSTIARSSVQAHDGASSMLITPDGITVTTGAIMSGISPATAGVSYRALGWIWSTVGIADARMAVDWRTAGGAFISTGLPTAVVVPANQWTLLDAVLVAPATTAQAQLRVRLGLTPTGLFYADGLRLIPVASYNASPQTLTVSGAAPVKSVASGSPISLANPARYAL